MSKVCVILSGAGHLDGAEMRESIFTLLNLDQLNISVDIFAPDMDQHHVINHLNGEVMDEKRNVLIESARLARGKIQALSELNPENYDALVMPGGFGVAKNLSDFALSGENAKIIQKVQNLILNFYTAKKPICAICIAPTLLALTLKDHNPEITIGNDEEMIATVEKIGANHFKKSITDIHIDEKNLLITTPAYMYGSGKLSNIFEGVSSAIKALDQMLKAAKEE